MNEKMILRDLNNMRTRMLLELEEECRQLQEESDAAEDDGEAQRILSMVKALDELRQVVVEKMAAAIKLCGRN